MKFCIPQSIINGLCVLMSLTGLFLCHFNAGFWFHWIYQVKFTKTVSAPLFCFIYARKLDLLLLVQEIFPPRSDFPLGFYKHQFHAAPHIQSALNPQVSSEMSHNLLLLYYYQSKSRRIRAVYRHFFTINPNFPFLQALLSRLSEPGASRWEDQQLTHKRLKIRFSAHL